MLLKSFASSLKIDNKYDKIYFYLFLLLAFSLPLSRAAISLFVLLIIFVWFIEGNFREKFRKIYENKALLVLIAFVIYMDITLLWSHNVTLKVFASVDYHYLLFIPMSYTILKREWTDKILTAFIFGMLASEIVSYGIYFKLWTYKHVSSADPTPFMSHVWYSMFLSFTSILLLSRIFSNYYDKKEKLLSIPFFLTVTINLFITGGRTGQVAFLFAIIIMLFIHYKASFKMLFYIIVLIPIIYVTAYLYSNTFQKKVSQTIKSIEKIYSKKDLTTSLGIRASYIIISSEILKQNSTNIIFGVGYNDVHSEIDKILKNKIYKEYKLDEKFIRGHNTHNQYLQLLLQGGVVGCILLFIFFIYIFKATYYRQEIQDISVLFLVVFLFSSLVDTILELEFPRTLFMVMVSLFFINMVDNKKLVKEKL